MKSTLALSRFSLQFGIFIVSAVISSSAFWIGFDLAIIADEMRYDPTHDSIWQTNQAHEISLSHLRIWVSIAFLILAAFSLVSAWRSRLRQSWDIISMASISVAALLGAVAVGFFVAAGLERL